jgi:Zn-dependent protease with chaperone function
LDFFQHQDDARKKTGRLVALFALGVFGVAAAVYAAVTIAFVYGAEYSSERPRIDVFEPQRLAIVFGGVLGFVALCALYRGATVAKDGKSVAEHLRGKLVPRGSTDPHERRLLNVVEEMAIASSLPVPPVYVLEDATINAFAAGRTPQDAVLGFTRGAITALDRDELQGVVAHEFSHVMHGDMRLNLRLMAWIFGVAALGQVGEFVLRSGVRGFRGSSRDKGGGGAAVVLGIALTLMVVGGLGYLAGRLIQAAVSRQREYLADASAVQFTRNPDGIASALAKISKLGSGLATPRAGEVRHLMFGATSKTFSALSATHPPIAERLARLGRVQFLTQRDVPKSARDAVAAQVQKQADRATVAAGFIASLGAARERLDELPAELETAARDAFGAAAVVLAVLRSHDPSTADLQDRTLTDWPELQREVRRLAPSAARLPAIERLPLVDLSIPALAMMSARQFERFDTAATAFSAADGRLEPFEWALAEVLRARLHPRFGRPVAPSSELPPAAVSGETRAVLSWMAHLSGNPADAPAAHRRGANLLRTAGLAVLAGEAPLDAGLCAARLARHSDRLRALAPHARRALLDACEAVARHDGRLRAPEAELLRALAEVLDVPTSLDANAGHAARADETLTREEASPAG